MVVGPRAALKLSLEASWPSRPKLWLTLKEARFVHANVTVTLTAGRYSKPERSRGSIELQLYGQHEADFLAGTLYFK